MLHWNSTFLRWLTAGNKLSYNGKIFVFKKLTQLANTTSFSPSLIVKLPNTCQVKERGCGFSISSTFHPEYCKYLYISRNKYFLQQQICRLLHIWARWREHHSVETICTISPDHHVSPNAPQHHLESFAPIMWVYTRSSLSTQFPTDLSNFFYTCWAFLTLTSHSMKVLWVQTMSGRTMPVCTSVMAKGQSKTKKQTVLLHCITRYPTALVTPGIPRVKLWSLRQRVIMTEASLFTRAVETRPQVSEPSTGWCG